MDVDVVGGREGVDVEPADRARARGDEEHGVQAGGEDVDGGEGGGGGAEGVMDLESGLRGVADYACDVFTWGGGGESDVLGRGEGREVIGVWCCCCYGELIDGLVLWACGEDLEIREVSTGVVQFDADFEGFILGDARDRLVDAQEGIGEFHGVWRPAGTLGRWPEGDFDPEAVEPNGGEVFGEDDVPLGRPAEFGGVQCP